MSIIFHFNTKKEKLVTGSLLLSREKQAQFSQMPSLGPPQSTSSLNPSLPPTSLAQPGHSGSGQCQQMPGHACGGLGGRYHFVGRPGAGVGGRAGRELQAPPLLLHGATLVPPHAVDLLFHAHLDLALAREYSTLGALLLQWEMGL